jgi:glycosyltransferase involved in cell wall biosynthesis
MERPALDSLASCLGVAEDVDLAGYVDNPCGFMARASVFCLTSLYEGFGNVTVEALACGCPVVATDSPGGQTEILEGGRFGLLVPTRDHAAVARALDEMLTNRPDPTPLRARAAGFNAVQSADSLLALLDDT